MGPTPRKATSTIPPLSSPPSSRHGWRAIPEDLLEHVFTHLTPPDLHHISLTCHTIHIAVHASPRSKNLWAMLLLHKHLLGRAGHTPGVQPTSLRDVWRLKHTLHHTPLLSAAPFPTPQGPLFATCMDCSRQVLYSAEVEGPQRVCTVRVGGGGTTRLAEGDMMGHVGTVYAHRFPAPLLCIAPIAAKMASGMVLSGHVR